MAQNTTTTVGPGGDWVQLTDSDVTSITIQNIGGSKVMLKGTTSATAPTDDSGAIHLGAGQALINEFLSDLWPGVASVRVYAKSQYGTQAVVSHA